MLLVLACACHDRRPLDAENAQAMFAPHAAGFARFARWAGRALTAKDAFADRAALEEAVFDPVRGDPAVAGAWVLGDGKPALAFGSPASPPSGRWTTLRRTTLGEVQVARWKGPGCGEGCVVVARQITPKVRVVVAYRGAAATRR